MTSLILFSGLPGTGKTTLARQLAVRLQIPHFSKDIFEARLFNDGLTDGHSAESYHLLLDIADSQLNVGVSVVLDAVFPLADFREKVGIIAEQRGARLYVIHTYCSDENLHKRRLRERKTAVPWTPVNWAEVQRIQSRYEPWPEDAALFLDAVNSLDQNFAKLLDYVRNN